MFLHGRALAHRTYGRALERLIAHDLRVYASALRGFGGTPRLPDEHLGAQLALDRSIGVLLPCNVVGSARRFPNTDRDTGFTAGRAVIWILEPLSQADPPPASPDPAAAGRLCRRFRVPGPWRVTS